jgi:chromosome segregation ATPase
LNFIFTSLADLIVEWKQIVKLKKELDNLLHSERTSSQRAARAVALCEAKVASVRRYALELKQKLRSADKRVGNLEDTVDALSGRVESELSRGEKLGTQNSALKELLDKQAKVSFCFLFEPVRRFDSLTLFRRWN